MTAKVTDTAISPENLDRKIRDALDKLVITHALKVEADAVRRAPKDTGALRANTDVALANEVLRSLHGAMSIAVITFKMPYAAVQHDRLDYRHQIGEALYLQNAAEENADDFIALIKSGLVSALRGSVR